MFYIERKELKTELKVHLDLTKSRLDLLIKVNKYLNSIPNVGFICADIIFRIKIHFSNNNESFFNSMSDLF